MPLQSPLDRAAEIGSPVIQSNFDVYLDGDKMIYVREQCSPEDIRTPFFLHIIPADVADLPDDRRDYGFDNLDFDFYEFSTVRRGETCGAMRKLPNYQFTGFSTGQFTGSGTVWSGAFDIGRLPTQPPWQRAEEIGSPVIQSNFDVYLDGNDLIYVREQCSPEDLLPRFFLHVVPANAADLSDDRRQHGFDNLDFDFYQSSAVQRGGACYAVRKIPDYQFTGFSTGQLTESGTVWSGAFHTGSLPTQPPWQRVEEISSPVIQSNFDVYLDGNDLIYVKQQCSPEDLLPRFFLHVVPADVADLPDDRQKYDFDNLDFDFYQSSAVQRDGACYAVRKLPDYQFIGFSTGQFTKSGTVWSGAFNPDSLPLQPPWQRMEEIGAPVIQSNFNVYLDGDDLIYVKEQCSPEDLLPRFFLHVVPADVADLPDDRRQHGFDNLDFKFSEYGVWEDGRCAATIRLPNYDIVVIKTGQLINGGRLWTAEFEVDHE